MILQEFLEKYVINRVITKVYTEYWYDRLAFEIQTDSNRYNRTTDLSFKGAFKLSQKGIVKTANDSNVELDASLDEMKKVELKKISDFKVNEFNDITIEIEDGYVLNLYNFQFNPDLPPDTKFYAIPEEMYFFRIFHWEYDVIFEHNEYHFRKNNPLELDRTKKYFEEKQRRNTEAN